MGYINRILWKQSLRGRFWLGFCLCTADFAIISTIEKDSEDQCPNQETRYRHVGKERIWQDGRSLSQNIADSSKCPIQQACAVEKHGSSSAFLCCFSAPCAGAHCSCASKKSCNLHEGSSHACSLMLFVSPCPSPSNRGKTKFYCNTQIYPNILFVIFVGSMKAINVYQIPHISIDFLQKYTQHMPKTLTELREMGQLRHQGQALMPLHLVKLPSALLRLMPIGAPTPSFVEWSTLYRRFL